MDWKWSNLGERRSSIYGLVNVRYEYKDGWIYDVKVSVGVGVYKGLEMFIV